MMDDFLVSSDDEPNFPGYYNIYIGPSKIEIYNKIVILIIQTKHATYCN